MLLGPLAILTCGILLVTLSDRHHVVVFISRLVDPIICSFLFLSYVFMISMPSINIDKHFIGILFLVRDVVHLVLQANPCSLKSNEVERTLRDSVCSYSI
jgi:hypothetical protein